MRRVNTRLTLADGAFRALGGHPFVPSAASESVFCSIRSIGSRDASTIKGSVMPKGMRFTRTTFLSKRDGFQIHLRQKRMNFTQS